MEMQIFVEAPFNDQVYLKNKFGNFKNPTGSAWKQNLKSGFRLEEGKKIIKKPWRYGGASSTFKCVFLKSKFFTVLVQGVL